MTRAVPLAIACGNYDRTRPLFDGSVRIDGCAPIFLPQEPEEIFFRAFAHAEFDVAELSLSSYAMRLSRGDCPYVAVPVFLSRAFRHSAVYVRTDRSVTRAQDLRGRRVGVPEYQLTAAVWIRGFLQEEYRVSPRDLRWICGGLETPGRVEKVPFSPPVDVSLEPAPRGATLSGLLEHGDIDALLSPRTPSCFLRGAPGVGRLFPNFGADEEAFYRRTRIFPIMHVLGIKADLAARHPWLPASIYKAFAAAKEIAVSSLGDPNALCASLPFLTWDAERARALMGRDYWPYGVTENAAVLEVFLRYHFEQGLSPRRLVPADLFVPNAASEWRV